jgi:hypothetical protein
MVIHGTHRDVRELTEHSNTEQCIITQATIYALHRSILAELHYACKA